MKELIKFIASMVIVYLLMCLIALKWTPAFNHYIQLDIGGRLVVLIGFFVAAIIVYWVIELIKLFI